MSQVERDWITQAGLRAVCLNTGRHRLGYVAVGRGHPLFGCGYRDPSPCLSVPTDEPIGKRGPFALLIAFGDEAHQRSPEFVFDVHGSLTFSGSGEEFCPVHSPGAWWFGFDCAHAGDGRIGEEGGDPARSQEYVEAECELLARQLIERPVRVEEPTP